jgi:hypothetical protein
MKSLVLTRMELPEPELIIASASPLPVCPM